MIMKLNWGFINKIRKTVLATALRSKPLKQMNILMMVHLMKRLLLSHVLPIPLSSSTRELETCGQTGPDCPLRCGPWTRDLVARNLLPGLRLLHTWIPLYPMLYLEQEQNTNVDNFDHFGQEPLVWQGIVRCPLVVIKSNDPSVKWLTIFDRQK